MKQRQGAILDEMSGGDVDGARMTKLSKEMASLSQVCDLLDRFEELVGDRDVANEMARDGEDMEEELRGIEGSIEALEVDLIKTLVPKDPADLDNCIVEVRAGTGGDEAGLFAAELLEMYRKYCSAQGWQFDVVSYSKTDIGGCKEAIAQVETSGAFGGVGPFGVLKHECGVHRVQRVPVNDVRVHTSSASVVVLPEVEDVNIEINEADLRIDTFRASGAGGQHVNTTDSAVRVTHLPTNTVVSIQSERSQHMNKAKAMALLRARIAEAEEERLQREQRLERSSQIGRGDRSERIRTYNFAQDRVTDHRVHMTQHGVQKMLNGEILDEFGGALRERELQERLEDFESAKGR